MTELPVSFGFENGLIGIYTPGAADNGVCCLFVNAGIIHRIGPHRLNVNMARSLAETSVSSLRFDLSGRGDSKAAVGAANYQQQAVDDVRTAMDFVTRTFGQRRFLIFGICSGAVNAFRSAINDDRVVGIFMVDGYWYRTRWTEPVRLWKRWRTLSIKSILQAVGRRFMRSPQSTKVEQPRAEIFTMEASNNPERAEFDRDMNILTGRGVKTFFLFTNSVTDLVSYAGQLGHAFRGEPFVAKMRCTQRLDIDHTMVSQSAQRATIALVRDWAATFTGQKPTIV